jgi:hypothetical protein
MEKINKIEKVDQDNFEEMIRYRALKLAIELYKQKISDSRFEIEQSDLKDLFEQADYNLKYIKNQSFEINLVVSPAERKRQQRKTFRFANDENKST